MSALLSRRGGRRGGAGLAQVGSLIQTVSIIVAVIIGIGIVFVLIDANPRNEIVSTFRDVAAWLATPFADLLTVRNPETRLIANWAVAAGVYLVVGTFIGRALVGRGLRSRR